MTRRAAVKRQTKETNVRLGLVLEGKGKGSISTGIGFLDHMLQLLSKHSGFDLEIEAAGDRRVDYHHTVEDVGICLGQALLEALGDKSGIVRFGEASVTMEDALASVVVDLSGRTFLVYNVKFPTEKVGDFDVALAEEFLQAFARSGKFNLHINVPYGRDSHHIAEAIFKALARALKSAVRIEDEEGGIPSTKGVL